jgi:hypothetical protein
MIFAIAAAALLMSPVPAVAHPAKPEARLFKAQFGGGTTCFKSGEQTSGMSKICYYNCLGSPAAITISSVELCPLTIQR